MAEPQILDPTTTHFVVKQLKPQKHGLSEADLITAIQDIEIQTQIKGSSLLKLHIIDEDWSIIRSGLFKVDEDGLLNELQVEFPEGTGYFWQLAAIEYSSEASQANLIPVFEDAIVAKMRKVWGHRTFPPGLTTRAQVVKALVDEVNLKLRLNPPIRFVSPGINRKEPVAEATPTKTTAAKAAQEAKENKSRGIHAGAEFKIKGLAPSPEQRAILNEAIGVADELNTPTLAAEALVEAMITENTVSSSGAGLLQFEAGTASGVGVTKGDIKQEVTAFLTKSYSGETLASGPGGANEYAKKHPNAAAYEVAQATQGSGAGQASKGAANYGPFHLEAQEILHAYGGVRTGGTTPTTSNESDVGQLSRGTPTDPDEDSWACAQRLASQVDWFFFTDGRNTVFYMDGPDLMAQRPVLYIDGANHKGELQPPADWRIIKEDKGGQKVEELGALIRPLSANYDNTAFRFRATHKVKGRIQRKTKIAKPQTPAEVRMNMVCGITEYRAGEVLVFRSMGPISENSGRWIMADVTRQCLKYPHSQFILVPPTEPLPEPKATATEAGAAAGGALAAFEAANTLSQMELPYLWGGGHQAKGLEGVAKGGPGLDCSGSTCWVLKQAGMFPASAAETSGSLATNWGEAGEGKEMTVWAGPNHVFIEFTGVHDANGVEHSTAQMNTNGPQNGPRLYTLSQTPTYNPAHNEGGPGASGGPFTPRRWKGV